MNLPSYSADVSVAAETTLAQQLQARTSRWPIAGRIAWWVLLLPVALALFSWARPAGWSRRIGLGVAAVLALFVVAGAVSDPSTKPNVATLASSAGQKSEDAAIARQAESDKAAADEAAAMAAADRKAAEALVAKAAADKTEAARVAAQAAAAKTAADKAATEQQAAADKAAADKAAADRAAASTAAEQSSSQQPASAPAPASKSYANCTELRADYKGGVARPGAVDHRSGGGHATYQPYYSSSLYEENSGKDRDGDGIACEA